MQKSTHRARQRGAVAVFAAVAMLAMLTAALVSIEIGRMYAARSELQKQANLAALDASRLVSGCSTADDGDIFETPSSDDLLGFVEQTILDNGLPADLLSGLPQVDTGLISRSTGVDGPAGMRYLAVDPEDAEAVRVTLRRRFPAPLLPLLPYDESREMVASATAGQLAVGSFYIGSGVVSVNGGVLNALLSGLLGGNVSLSAVNYNGLADVNVALTDLLTAVDLDVEDLSDPLALDTETPVLSDLIDGLADALSGGASADVVSLLQQLAATAQSGNNSPVPLGGLIGGLDPATANVPFVNLLDLLVAMGAAANADPDGNVAPIALPVSVNLPGVTAVHTFIRLLEPPQFSGMKRAGEGRASSAQIQLQVRLQVGSNVLAGVLDPIRLGIDVEVARASAFLEQIKCPRSANPDIAAVLSATPSVAMVRMGTYAGDPSTAPPIASGAASLARVHVPLGIGQVTVNLQLNNPSALCVGGGNCSSPYESRERLDQDITAFTRIEADADRPYWLADKVPGVNPQTIGSSNLLRSAVSSLSASVIGNISPVGTQVCVLFICLPIGNVLDAVLSPVISLLTPVLSGLLGVVDGVLDPLLQALGVQLGVATVTMTAVSIDQPQILSMEVPVAAP